MRHFSRGLALSLIAGAACGCQAPAPIHAEAPQPLPHVMATQPARPVGGRIAAQAAIPPIVSAGMPRLTQEAQATGPGRYALDFADTDIREAAAQILGSMLGVTYAIDPAVKGTVTLHTAGKLSAAQLLPTLQTLLAGVGAALVRGEELYQVVPEAAAGGGGQLVALRFADAAQLAKVLQPLVGATTRLAAEPALNTLIVGGDPASARAVAELARSFDSDALAGQSYAVLPATAGTAKDLADGLSEALQSSGREGRLRIMPLGRMNAVLVVSAQPRDIDEARRVFAAIERERGLTQRVWHTHYLQNSNVADIAPTLQMAFTPNSVTASAPAVMSASPTSGAAGLGAGGIRAGTAGQATPQPAAPAQSDPQAAPAAAQPGSETGETGSDTMRILPIAQINALLVYATAQEEDLVTAMLQKIDVLPLQVRIDATIAEVTLNDQLQYGTQFFFKSGGVNSVLSTATSTPSRIASIASGLSFPGFFLGGTGAGGAPIALQALQAVTRVNVLSSPQIMVMDNRSARLQVGALVPYLTASQQSTLTSGAPVVNTIGYQPTGIIMEVTPRVNGGGLVTLDVSQEVSNVDSTTTTGGIASPTFNERRVTSRVVVQDGQTVGLAGLISDTTSTGNSGIPWLKDVPVLGVLAGTQDNTRNRTELLVLITPHVIRDQAQSRALTDDMRDALGHAAALPQTLRGMPLSGSNDPNRDVRTKAGAGLGLDRPPADQRP